MRWWWFLGLAACGDQYKFDQACHDTYAAICKHQIDCEQIDTSDQAQCESDLKSSQLCDDSKPISDFETCQNVILNAACTEREPCECFYVMCDASLGCLDNSTAGCDYTDTGATSGSHR